MTLINIAALGRRGEGIAEYEGRRIFVPLTLPGEKVGAEIDGERGSLVSIVEASPERIAPFCPHFGPCGGCQLQHLSAESYASFKHGLIETALHHAGIETEIAPLIDARGAGRRRITLHALRTGAGFMGFHTHHLHNIDRCPITVPALAEAPAIARACYTAVGNCDVGLTATLTGLDVEVKPKKRAKPERLAPLLAQFRLARVSLDGEPVLMAQPPAVKMGKATVEIAPQGFLQATEAAEDILASQVLAGLKGLTNVADLFAGAGPFALRLAEASRVYAADSDRAGIEALGKAYRHTKGLKQIETARRDLFREPLTAIELNRFDGIVFDPPRAGAEAQSCEIARSKVKQVVAVSCDPTTFARDARILIDGGYKLDGVTPVDQFAFSTHVEIVGLFRR